jgi:putative molybdopterin biosynthesis protein
MKPLPEAQAAFLATVPEGATTAAEVVPAELALGRVTAEPLFARLSSPLFHCAAMDGIAVKAADTYGASEERPVRLEEGRHFRYVNTGNAMPEGTDAVVMIEFVNPVGEGAVEIDKAAYPWQHVRKVGEDIVATELILPEGQRLNAYEVGALVTAGVWQVPVRRRPRVAIIPTGTELVRHTQGEPGPGKVIESNSIVLAALLEGWGGEGVICDIVRDDYEALKDAVRRALETADAVVISAGSSAGSEDYTASVVEELGELLVHGVTIMPGKPTVLGQIGGKPVMGNPGYPVSAIISFELFVYPLICRMLGVRPERRQTIPVTPSRKLPSRLGLEEFLRVKLGRVGEKTIATPLPRGAGSISTLTRADGILRIPAESEGVADGEVVQAELLRPEDDVLNTIVCIGSHDLTIDVLANELRRRDHRLSLSSANVGSLGGLLAVGKGTAHLAGCHLFDPETGDYNAPYIKQYLPGLPLRLVNLVFREQGLVVAKGNPKGITGVADLARNDVTFINRQAGSGTRILLDHELKRAGIKPSAVNGYEHEEFTHMAVAVDVLSGRADVGLAIYASAKALGLDFVPVCVERYDLAIPEVYFNDPRVQVLLDVIRSEGFQARVRELGGYQLERTGEVVWSQ